MRLEGGGGGEKEKSTEEVKELICNCNKGSKFTGDSFCNSKKMFESDSQIYLDTTFIVLIKLSLLSVP